MSTPRSGSPRYRRFPWEEPGFDPEKVVAELDGNPPEGGRRFREDPEERVESLGGRNMYPEGQRRSGSRSGSGPFPDGHPEFYHGRHDDHRLPPLDAERRGGGSSRERFRKFGSRETLSRSPSRGRRDGSRTHSDHQEPRSGWWREDQDQDPGLDPGPGLGPGPGPRGSCSPISAHHQADGPPGRARLRQNPHQDRTPPFKRPRRDLEDAEHLGFRAEEDFRARGFSVDRPGSGSGGDPRGPPGPVVIEHNHSSAAHWGASEERRRSPPPHSGTPAGSREGRRFQGHSGDDGYRKTARSHEGRDDRAGSYRGGGGARRGSLSGHPRDPPPQDQRAGYQSNRGGPPHHHQDQRRGYQSDRGSIPHQDHREGYQSLRGSPPHKDQREEYQSLRGGSPHQREGYQSNRGAGYQSSRGGPPYKDQREGYQSLRGSPPFKDHREGSQSLRGGTPYKDHREGYQSLRGSPPHKDHREGYQSLRGSPPYKDQREGHQSLRGSPPYKDQREGHQSLRGSPPYKDHREGYQSLRGSPPYKDHGEGYQSLRGGTPYKDQREGYQFNRGGPPYKREGYQSRRGAGYQSFRGGPPHQNQREGYQSNRGAGFQSNRGKGYQSLRGGPSHQDQREGYQSNRGGQPHQDQREEYQSNRGKGYQSLRGAGFQSNRGKGYQSLRGAGFQSLRGGLRDPGEGGAVWREQGRPRGLERPPHRDEPDPAFPGHGEPGWSQKADSMTVVTEETLTIKVDMSRPLNRNSSLCYSSDRQLSLDLVNVGRRRLDFLPLLEPSGQEPAVHSGTFAQEVISLVHQVKEQYFRGDGVTLNERFSAPPPLDPGPPEEELTLHQRFGSGRGFSLDLDLDLDQDPDLDEEPLFSRLGPVQPPGDLRHDLERRRQQKLEGVKVTIAGGRNPGPNR